MSASLAAARKRRGIATPEPPVTPTQSQQGPPPSGGLTLPQVIALVDKRLITLETFMKEQKEKPVEVHQQPLQPSKNNIQLLENDVLKTEIENMALEFNERYELLAAEIQNMKDIVLKLQAYTMEVNKTLIDERVRILSDVENTTNLTIDEEELENDV